MKSSIAGITRVSLLVVLVAVSVTSCSQQIVGSLSSSSPIDRESFDLNPQYTPSDLIDEKKRRAILHAMKNSFMSEYEPRMTFEGFEWLPPHEHSFVGKIADIEKFLDRFPIPDESKNEVKRINEATLAGHAPHQILDQVLGYARNNMDKVFLVLTDSADLGSLGRYDFTVRNSYYGISNELEIIDRNFQPGMLAQPIEVGLEFVAVVSPSELPEAWGEAIPRAWVSILWHELAHYFDAYVIYRWIFANQLLINRGEQPDDMFKRFVEVKKPGTPSEKVIINNRFRAAFTVIRAHDVMYPVQKLGDVPFDENFFGETAIAKLNSWVPGILEENPGGFFSFDENTPASIFAVGQKLGEMMHETIDRAGMSLLPLSETQNLVCGSKYC